MEGNLHPPRNENEVFHILSVHEWTKNQFSLKKEISFQMKMCTRGYGQADDSSVTEKITLQGFIFNVHSFLAVVRKFTVTSRGKF